MGTACDTAGIREVGETKVEKDRKVRGQIAWREPEVFVVEHVSTIGA